MSQEEILKILNKQKKPIWLTARDITNLMANEKKAHNYLQKLRRSREIDYKFESNDKRNIEIFYYRSLKWNKI